MFIMNELVSTDKHILVCYPRGAGGKFVLNSLCFNENFYPQIDLKTYSKNRDIPSFLLGRLKSFVKTKTVNEWNDLGMGTSNFFTHNKIVQSMFFPPPGKSLFDDKDVERFQTILNQSSPYMRSTGKYFFTVAHTVDYYNFYKKVWYNSKVIKLINCEEWVERRIKKMHIDAKYSKKESIGDIQYDVTFDVNSLFSYDSFIAEYIKILKYFNCTLINEDLLKEFYTIYRNFII